MILVTGAKGFVGHTLMALLADTMASVSLRGATEEAIHRIVEESGADVIIHTAAISDIAKCEADVEASYNANVLLPVYLARAAQGRKLIVFSSDQVYSACVDPGPYTEDQASPGNTYARHKLEMEQRVMDLFPEAIILRAEWMYDLYNLRKNYFMQVVEADSVLTFSSHQYRGVTYVREVAEAMRKVIELPGGVYNFGSETTSSMYDITHSFLQYLGKHIELKDGPFRHNLWMDCCKAKAYGVRFSEVSEGLIRCARDHGISLPGLKETSRKIQAGETARQDDHQDGRDE